MVEKITSLQNPRLKNALRLMERKERDQQKLFLIEGYRELSHAVQSNVKIETLFFCPELFLGENEGALIATLKERGSLLLECSSPVFAKLSYRDRPDGLVAVGVQMDYSWDLFTPSNSRAPFFVIAEAIEKPGNLGTILRSSDAANVDGLFLCDRCTDLYNPNVVRASVGTLFTVPAKEVRSDELLAWLSNHKIQIVAATPSAEKEFTQVDLTGPVAIVVGTEQLGLSDKWMNLADVKVKIPMLGAANSLNVGSATTLLLYEVVRQRRRS